jgi:uncharacterized protein (TIGR02118 family)
MVKLTCLVHRRADMSPEEFHTYWREHHGPLVASTASGSHVIRYVQHHRCIDDYTGDDDPGFDGVTEQWFASMDEYRAHIAEPDFQTVWADVESFLDVKRLFFVLTEEPVVIVAGPDPFEATPPD